MGDIALNYVFGLVWNLKNSSSKSGNIQLISGIFQFEIRKIYIITWNAHVWTQLGYICCVFWIIIISLCFGAVLVIVVFPCVSFSRVGLLMSHLVVSSTVIFCCPILIKQVWVSWFVKFAFFRCLKPSFHHQLLYPHCLTAWSLTRSNYSHNTYCLRGLWRWSCWDPVWVPQQHWRGSWECDLHRRSKQLPEDPGAGMGAVTRMWSQKLLSRKGWTECLN